MSNRISRRRLAAGLFFSTLLAACGGGGSSGGGSVESSLAISDGNSVAGVSGSTDRTGNQLFVADIGHSVIAALPTLDPAPGSLLPATPISVAGNLRSSNVQYDAGRDELYAAAGNSNPAEIVVYSGATAGATPSRRFALPANVLRRRLVLDPASDTLYVGVGRSYDGAILIYANASTRSGTTAPNRTVVIARGLTDLADLAIDLPQATAYLATGDGIGRLGRIDIASRDRDAPVQLLMPHAG